MNIKSAVKNVKPTFVPRCVRFLLFFTLVLHNGSAVKVQKNELRKNEQGTY